MTDDREDYAQLLYYLKNIDIKKVATKNHEPCGPSDE